MPESKLSSALTSLGADLTFSVSFSVARELLDGAQEWQLGEDELIFIVLGLSVLLNSLPDAVRALPGILSSVVSTAAALWGSVTRGDRGSEGASAEKANVCRLNVHKAVTVRNGASGASGASSAGDAATAEASGSSPEQERPGVMAFLELFVTIAQRISLSLVVQLLAANVRANQSIRSVRILTLLSVATFFLFLESTAGVGKALKQA
tara:strand:- start:2250 stop:2873 length:624 start_codon:yes stop_codon:yes gene_type:complete